MSDKGRWEKIYARKTEQQVSWYRPHLELSLDLIQMAGLKKDAHIIDVGGGASTLVEDHLKHGYTNVTVLDLSPAALDVTKRG